jgi:hypothetical protein
MASTSATYHETVDVLQPKTREFHRALASLMEELEAVDWYQQRVDAAEDPELRAILEHNRDEEMEHAAMLLEWIRRHQPTFAGYLRKYLFSERPIVGPEEREEAAPSLNDGPNLALRRSIGSLKGGR